MVGHQALPRSSTPCNGSFGTSFLLVVLSMFNTVLVLWHQHVPKPMTSPMSHILVFGKCHEANKNCSYAQRTYRT
eukprot:6474169-Amphidinium_carterae.1